MAKSRLGKGLGALFPTIPEEKSPAAPAAEKSPAETAQEQKTASKTEKVDNAKSSKRTSTAKDSRSPIPDWGAIAHPSDMFFSNTRAGDGGVAQNESDVSRETMKSDARDGSKTTPVKSEAQVLEDVKGAYLAELNLDDIEANAHQPRSVFDEDELKELSDSIKEVGVLQPIVVRERTDGGNTDSADAKYELIMGERRLRASGLAGKETIPAIVRTTDDSNMLRDALLENLHRVQLNPLEEAAAYEQMIEEFGLTQAQLSKSVSKSRPQIANTLRLLQLPGSVQKRVASGVLSAGHARALLSLDSEEQMMSLAARIVAEGLSVRSTEEIVALQKNSHSDKKSAKRTSKNYWSGSSLPQRLGDKFDTKVSIRGSEKKGRIEITFASSEDLQRITDLLVGNGLQEPKANGWV
ncbi:MAG: ParB/RepB/Spo0J family partition protein [Bifidobacteriaceae bacterium]|jgi:ParB family chromosome partitioning protein|nr:ParB/RepB/Spo0J family partition protein [Bifidobacteriaceae bacterium]